MKVGLVGSVDSSLLTLQKLYEYNYDIVGVWGFEPDTTKNVSGFCSLKKFAEDHSLPFFPFIKINDAKHKEEFRHSGVELLFIVGLSQMVDKEIIDLPRYGCVGFHPTKLPHGRGRAPLAWLVMNEREGAATFFRIEDGPDSGEIFVQEQFIINDQDDALSVRDKLNSCILSALDKWLPKLKDNEPVGVKQDERNATYYARRAPLDGYLDWEKNAYFLDRVVKAATIPHPGAYTFYEDFKVIIWKSSYHKEGFPIGVVGRVVDFVHDNPVIQTGDGYLEIKDYVMIDFHDKPVEKRLVIGSRLGYYDHYEIFKLRNEVKEIKQLISDLYEKNSGNCTAS